MDIGNIIHGHVNEALNINEDLSKERLKICNNCPIHSEKFGGLCNNKLWLNKETGDVSLYQKDGYIRGCGCRTSAKTRLPNAHCPAGKW